MKKRAAADPFPAEVELRRGRRRSVELSLEDGRLVARAPRRMAEGRVQAVVAELRPQLWANLRRRYVYDDEALHALALEVAGARLGDLRLPPWTTRFSSRQRKRWGSCTVERDGGRIRVSDRLRGHARWVLEHLLLHELIHLQVQDHGPRFRALLERCPHRERAAGYLEALETRELHGPGLAVEAAPVGTGTPGPETDPGDDLPLFARRR